MITRLRSSRRGRYLRMKALHQSGRFNKRKARYPKRHNPCSFGVNTMPCEKMRELENTWRAIQAHRRNCSVCGDRRPRLLQCWFRLGTMQRLSVALHDERATRLCSLFSLRITLAGTMLFLSPLAALSSSTTPHSGCAGIYLSHASKTAPSMSLSLGADGTATITEDIGKGATTFFGHWIDSGSQVTVTFDAVEGKPAEPPMVFQPGADGLRAVMWNRVAWGNVNPPPMKKGNKMKESYWFTTVR